MKGTTLWGMNRNVDYDQLPQRLIVQSPFKQQPILSYGLIPYSRATGRWLIVQRRHSPALMLLLRGSYRVAQVPLFISYLPRSELVKVNQVQGNWGRFQALYTDTIGTIDEQDMNYGYLRWCECIKGPYPLPEGRPEPEWLWPKGVQNSTKEEPLDCAYREFREETGVSEVGSIKQPACNEVVKGLTGRVYKTYCWLYVMDDEAPLSEPVGDCEVGARRWVNESEAKLLLSHTRWRMLKQAKKLLQRSAGEKTCFKSFYLSPLDLCEMGSLRS